MTNATESQRADCPQMRPVSTRGAMHPAASLARPMRVLLAESDRALRAHLARELARDGHVVVEARDALELFDHVASAYLWEGMTALFDMVVANTDQDGWSGLQILATLRAVNWGVPVILIADPADPEVYAAALRFGAVAVFERPFESYDLRTAVLYGLPADVRPMSRRLAR